MHAPEITAKPFDIALGCERFSSFFISRSRYDTIILKTKSASLGRCCIDMSIGGIFLPSKASFLTIIAFEKRSYPGAISRDITAGIFHLLQLCLCFPYCSFSKVDMYCELLNEQISAERYRNAGSGCGRGDSTPYVRDTALLSFRHSFVLNVHVCMPLNLCSNRHGGAMFIQPRGS